MKKEKSYFTRFDMDTNRPSKIIIHNGKVVNSSLRVKSLRESLDSCKPLAPSKSKSQYRLFSHSLKASVKSTFLRLSHKSNTSSPKHEAHSGGDVGDVNHNNHHMTSGELRELGDAYDGSTSTEALTTANMSSKSMNNKRKVGFSQIHARMYHIECDDNPGIGGKGPAIHLSWKYDHEVHVSVDDYEAARPEQPAQMKDMKMTLIERERLLLQRGASRAELRAFAKRIQKAKVRRAQTVEELTVYGKANMAKAEKRMEKWEGVTTRVKRVLHLKRTETNEQKRLWKKIQKEQQKARQDQQQQGHSAPAAIATQ